MKQIAAALVKAQREKDAETEARLLKQVANDMFPTRKVNAVSATPMPGRFIEKIVLGATDCWHWRGSIDEVGYGRFAHEVENKAHRVAYRLFVGPIPAGRMVLHRCDNRACVNPEHLFLGNQTDNMRDMVAKGRGKHPELTGERNPMARLSAQQVQMIRDMVSGGQTQAAAAESFGVSKMTVSRIVRRLSWN